MDAEETGRLGKELSSNQLLEQTEAEVRGGVNLPPILGAPCSSGLLRAEPITCPGKVQGPAGIEEPGDGSWLRNEAPALPPGCPAAPR